MKLSDIITGTQTVELIEPRAADSRYLHGPLRFLLVDADGASELTIYPDALAMPDEAILIWGVVPLELPVFSRETGEWVDDGLNVVSDETEPDFGWCVAIDGTETDTRAVSGGLF